MLALACGGLAACGDDNGSDDDAGAEASGLDADAFETLCDAVTEYAAATVQPGTGEENRDAIDALQTLVQAVQETGAAGRDDASLRVLRGCVDDLTNVLQAASTS